MKSITLAPTRLANQASEIDTCLTLIEAMNRILFTQKHSKSRYQYK